MNLDIKSQTWLVSYLNGLPSEVNQWKSGATISLLGPTATLVSFELEKSMAPFLIYSSYF